jgi:flagellar L-ring protein precursor FlgH
MHYHRISSLLLIGCLAAAYFSVVDNAAAESLFRAGANYNQQVGYTPSSFFAQPVPRGIGDIVTINIDEQSTLTNSASLSVEREQTVTDNKAGILSGLLHSVGVPERFAFPTLNGINSENELDSSAQAQRSSRLQDRVTCQVVQVLPNGNLVVQGEKVVLVNKDRVNMVVSGIVNPYYVDNNNTIASTQVANFQMLMGGRGVINRQQNDGFTNKLYSVFQ